MREKSQADGPGLTIEQLVVKTKQPKKKIKYYYDLGLLPKPVEIDKVVYWDRTCPELIRRIRDNRLLTPKDIRRKFKNPPTRHASAPQWQEPVKNTKFKKYDKTFRGTTYDHLESIRFFKPLKPQDVNMKRGIVLHIPIRMISRERVRNRPAELDCLVKTMELLEKYNSKRPVNGELVISVNGFISQDFVQEIKWLQDKDGTKLGSQWKNITIFQRPNYGYQWGGFFDVWSRYKYIKCNYFATMEVDCFLMPGWWEKCTDNIKEKGYLGMPPAREIQRVADHFYTSRIWRSGGDEVLNEKKARYRKIMKHTRGGFYFCTRECLEKLENTFGHFTDSMAADQELDGVTLGEIGFASRVNQIGYRFGTVEGVSYCSEDAGWPP